ncbi:MAG: FHA domain-containing protein [bacterium]|nr:FHA domain-containing protein [bacterium]
MAMRAEEKMNPVQDLVQQYSRLRGRGTAATVALEILRPQIECLAKADQTEIVRQVRMVEALLKTPSKAQPLTAESPTPAPSPIRSLKPNAAAANSPESVRPLYVGVKTSNCSRCGKPNPVDEVLCAHCGNFLQTGKSAFETTRLEEGGGSDTSYFGEESTLLLMLRDTNYAFKLRPQDNRHDIVVGRSNGASMKPDIDLLEHGGDTHGISRLHMSVRYEPKDKTVCVIDMNSANGTFLNGQRLHPREVRVVRNGDELRLGRLVMKVYLQHGVGK